MIEADTSDVEELRLTPKDLSDASVMSQNGRFVDVTSLISADAEGGAMDSLRDEMQEIFDWIAKTINSSEYAKFKTEIGVMLDQVKNNSFIFDIEGVMMSDIPSPDDNFSEELVYYAVPWTSPVLMKLIENGNHVGFWTSGTEGDLEKMKKTMIPELSSLPAISRDGFRKVALAYRARGLKEMTDERVIETMKSVYPTANQQTFQAGLDIFDKSMIDRLLRDDNFLRNNKYPQLFITPENGFFVDDNDKFIDSATKNGWPKDRAVKCKMTPMKNDVLEVVQAIKEEVIATSTTLTKLMQKV